MTTNLVNINNRPARRLRLRRWHSALLATFGLLLLAATIFLTTSPGRRWLARSATAMPVSGVTTVQVVANPTLNHVFAPASIRVPAGSTVTWQFADIDEDGQPVAHNVRFSDESGSAVLTTGEFSRTFDAPGEYTYVCTLHAYMNGRVVVDAAN